MKIRFLFKKLGGENNDHEKNYTIFAAPSKGEKKVSNRS